MARRGWRSSALNPLSPFFSGKAPSAASAASPGAMRDVGSPPGAAGKAFARRCFLGQGTLLPSTLQHSSQKQMPPPQRPGRSERARAKGGGKPWEPPRSPGAVSSGSQPRPRQAVGASWGLVGLSTFPVPQTSFVLVPKPATANAFLFPLGEAWCSPRRERGSASSRPVPAPGSPAMSPASPLLLARSFRSGCQQSSQTPGR